MLGVEDEDRRNRCEDNVQNDSRERVFENHALVDDPAQAGDELGAPTDFRHGLRRPRAEAEPGGGREEEGEGIGE